jgi:hypothetical protein
LLLNLSDNRLEQAQFNAVVPSQKEMNRVGLFEPTTSAAQQLLDYYVQVFVIINA